jgi:CubicO group peptidase (beta-lactamase class C family)
MHSLKSVAVRISLAAMVVLFVGEALADTPSQETIDETAERAMKAFDAPGMAVSIVHEGELVHAAGYGIVETGKPAEVDEHTLFQIGSVAKAFTAATLALLADDGKLGFDDRVIDHLPEFRLSDPWVTREFTIRDLLTHRSGLPLGAGDLLMFPDGNATAAEIIRALGYFEPATSFRSEFAYDNLLYIVAGEVVARVSGKTFADYLEQELLTPLGMNDCVAYADRARPDAELATAHVLVDGELETTTTRVTPLVAAAGGIACSAQSMSRWMKFMLSKGKSDDGKQLVSEKTFAELVKPVTLLPVPGFLAEHAGAVLNAYALGWNFSTFHGEPMLSHGGGVWGMTTFIAVMPEQNLAVFASNNQMSAAPRAAVQAIVELYLRDSIADADEDWIEIFGEFAEDRSDAAEETVEKAWAARAADSKPALPLDAYAGVYRDPWYGTVKISVEDEKLWFRSDRNEPLQGPMEHFQHDTFVARWTDRRLNADAYVTFSLAPDGIVDGIRMKAVSPATDFSYDFHDLDLRREPK